MKTDKLADLVAATAAAYDREHQKLRPVLEQEAQFQNRLSQLDAQSAQVRSDASQADGYRIAGADVVWHKWESSMRRHLNTELARVRSQKLAMMDELRTAFGRKQAIEAVFEKQMADRRSARRKKMSEYQN